MNLYNKIKLRKILIFFIILGTINYGFMAFNNNLLESIIKSISYGNINIIKLLYLIISISGLYIAFDITTWLPFLGESILPSTLVPLHKPSNIDTIIKINTIPNTKIAYWASDNKDITNVKDAYNNYNNSGVVLSDNNGVAELYIIKGNDYKVPNGKLIKKHVHYRTLGNEYQIMGKIETIEY